MAIPSWPVSGARERELLDEVLASDRWGGYHPFVTRFEQEFADVPAMPVWSERMQWHSNAREMALEALGIGEGATKSSSRRFLLSRPLPP